jgi:tRNA (adenine57-N1/adenine58-N1)-methyltransferase catalytic subunit
MEAAAGEGKEASVSAGPFQAGERALLLDLRGRRYLVTLAGGKEFHSHHGALQHDAIIGGPEGSFVETGGGSRMLVVRPTLADFVLKMSRGAQIVYPKDIGAILVEADIAPGSSVLEAGTGSGSLTLALSRAVGDGGRVVSYEVRDDHHERAVENIAAFYESLGGKPENLELRIGDIFEGVPDRDFDRVVLDLPEPWKAIGTATESLAAGGILCSYLPTIPQVQQLVEAMKGGGFGLVNTFEILRRTWNIDERSVRPDHRMVAHTGFIVTGRKLASRRS